MTLTDLLDEAPAPEPLDLAAVKRLLTAVPETRLRVTIDEGNADRLVLVAGDEVVTDFFIGDAHAEAYAALFAQAPVIIAALLAEVERWELEDEIWERHSLVQIVEERDKLRAELAEIDGFLEKVDQ